MVLTIREFPFYIRHYVRLSRTIRILSCTLAGSHAVSVLERPRPRVQEPEENFTSRTQQSENCYKDPAERVGDIFWDSVSMYSRNHILDPLSRTAPRCVGRAATRNGRLSNNEGLSGFELWYTGFVFSVTIFLIFGMHVRDDINHSPPADSGFIS